MSLLVGAARRGMIPGLFRAYQRVALSPGAELDLALGIEVGECDRLHLAGDDGVVEARAAALDQAARLAPRRGEPGAHEQFEGWHTARQHIARQRDLRQLSAGAARLED